MKCGNALDAIPTLLPLQQTMNERLLRVATDKASLNLLMFLNPALAGPTDEVQTR